MNTQNESMDESVMHQSPVENLSSHDLVSALSVLSQSLTDTPVHHTLRLLLVALHDALQEGETPLNLLRRIRRDRRKLPPVTTPLSHSQAQATLAEVRRLRAIARERLTTPGKQKLDPYRQEIDELAKAGASQRDIGFWLRREKRLKVSQATIQRYLVKIKTYEQETQFP